MNYNRKLTHEQAKANPDTNIYSQCASEMDAPDDSACRVGRFSHAVDKNDLKCGDHIYIYKLKLYSHHGIYVGSDYNNVIHVSGKEKTNEPAQVESCELKEFLDGRQLRLVSYGSSEVGRKYKMHSTCYCTKSRPASEVVATAQYYLKHPNEWGGYNLLENNCEHFAFHCKTGIQYSDQTGFGECYPEPVPPSLLSPFSLPSRVAYQYNELTTDSLYCKIGSLIAARIVTRFEDSQSSES